MDKVEKAVLDLDGQWPIEDCNNGGYLVWGLGSEVYYSKTDESATSRRFEDYICTYTEFMEARKRLENKPEWQDVPEWANWIAQSPCGHWEGFSGKPVADGYWRYDGEFRGEKIADGKLFSDWSQSLEPRPQPDHKEGEGVEWEPGVDLPPIGVECEFQYGIATQGKGYVKFYGSDYCVIQNTTKGEEREQIGKIEDYKFMPISIQSHRDKVIEAAHKACSEYIDDAILYDLYAACMLKLPGEEE